MQRRFNKQKIKNFLLATTSFVALSCGHTSPPATPLPQPQKDTVECVVTNPIKNVSFRNDTLYQGTSTLLYYLNNNITRNYVEKKQSYRLQLPYFAHEHKHDNNEKVDNLPRSYRIKYLYSPSQYATLCMYDEISANSVAIETAAFEYLTAANKENVIKKYENTYMKFYFEGIKNKTIRPLEFDDINELKNRREELDSYRSFLINGTQDMWQENYRAHYSPNQFNMVLRYIENLGLNKPHNANFNHVLQHMLTIGGVDFSQYLTHTIEPYDMRVKLFDEMAYVHSFTKDPKSSGFIVRDVAENYANLDNFSSPELTDAIQHMFVAAKLKDKLKSYTPEELISRPNLVATSYNKVIYELSKDDSFYNFLKTTSLNQKVSLRNSPCSDLYKCVLPFNRKTYFDDDYNQKISQFYAFKGVNLTSFISSFDVHHLPASLGFFASSELNFYIKSKNDDILSITDFINLQNTIEKEKTSLKSAELSNVKEHPIQPALRRRLSDNLYMPVIDFTLPVLVPGALIDEAKQKISDMFAMFEDIPSAFKFCDTQAQQDYISQHGNPHYFEDANNPLLPQKKRLAAIRNLRHQTASRQKNILKKDNYRD